jgi:tRNA1Val (adenine37-N6)-methyltransferase
MNENQYLRPGERIDDLQRGGSAPQERVQDLQDPGSSHENTGSPQQDGLRIIQDPARFCFGMDAVLLSAYVQMKKARRGLDLGTGNGIIPILLSDRTDCEHLTGLEIQPASADLARRSLALNGLEDRISIVQGDIKEADRIFAAASFDFITCNPPYRTVGSGKVSGTPAGGTGAASAENSGSSNGKRKAAEAAQAAVSRIGDPLQGFDPRAIARHELLCTFEDVARVTARLLRPGGHFYLVHRPLRLPELITTLCARGLEPKRMRLVYPHIDQAPNMVLLDCVRGGAPELRVEPPLIVYEKDGSYTPELLKIYYE